MTPVRFAAGEPVFAEGDPADRCFKIIIGRVAIRLTLGQAATCGPGEIIGEMGAIGRGPRVASAVALEPTLCLSYSADEIQLVLENDPVEALSYVRFLIRHLRQQERRLTWSAARSRTEETVAIPGGRKANQ